MKKIVAIIVEGISDETVITTGLCHVLESDEYHIQIFRGNILTSDIDSQKSSRALLGDYIKEYILKPRHLNIDDIAFIIQVADIDDVYSSSNLNRFQNLHKQRLNELSRTKYILDIPYFIYYMSANLEEVLSGKKKCTKEEKEEISNEFALKYIEDYPGYKEFFDLLIAGNFSNYDSSWTFIKGGYNGKMSNLSFLLELVEELKQQSISNEVVLQP